MQLLHQHYYWLDTRVMTDESVAYWVAMFDSMEKMLDPSRSISG